MGQQNQYGYPPTDTLASSMDEWDTLLVSFEHFDMMNRSDTLPLYSHSVLATKLFLLLRLSYKPYQHVLYEVPGVSIPYTWMAAPLSFPIANILLQLSFHPCVGSTALDFHLSALVIHEQSMNVVWIILGPLLCSFSTVLELVVARQSVTS